MCFVSIMPLDSDVHDTRLQIIIDVPTLHMLIPSCFLFLIHALNVNHNETSHPPCKVTAPIMK